MARNDDKEKKHGGWFGLVLRWLMEHKLIVFLLLFLSVAWGLWISPLAWDMGSLPRWAMRLEAMPYVEAKQQIVLTKWQGQSAQAVEDQITHPLMATLLNIPGIQTVRGYSCAGLSVISMIFRAEVAFEWSRIQVQEKLKNLSSDVLPAGVTASLGSEARGWEPILWYRLEGRDPKGHTAGKWGLADLREIQERYVRNALQSVKGVAEVVSLGGGVIEYHIAIDPAKLQLHKLTLREVYRAIQNTKQISETYATEIDNVAYTLQLQSLLRDIKDLEHTVIRINHGQKVLLKDVATIARETSPRSGILGIGGQEAVGGVVIGRYDADLPQTIEDLATRIKEISPVLPRQRLADGRTAQVSIVPLYKRYHWLQETLANIEQLIASEILLVLLVLLLFSVNVRTALMTGAIVPIAIALTFVAMKLFGVKADMIALLGISIAIGLIADMGIVLSDELARVIANMKEEEQVKDTVWRAVSRQGGLLCTMGCATIIGFLPALALQSSANPLFRPLIFAVVIALLVGLFSALVFLPSIALLVYRAQKASSVKRNFFQKVWRHFTNVALLTIGLILAILIWGWLGLFVALIAVYRWAIWVLPDWWKKIAPVASKIINWLGSAMLFAYLAHHWRPLGPDYGLISNLFYTLLLVSLVLGGFELLRRKYEKLLRLVLAHRILFLLIPAFLILYGFQIGIGFEKLHAWIYPIFARSAPSTNSQTKPPSSRPQPRPQPRQDQAQIGKPPPPETAPARPTTMPEHTDNTTDIASTQPTTFPHKDAQTAEPTGSPPLLQGPSWLSWSYWRSIFSLQRREFSPKFDQGLLALRLVTRPDSTAVQALASYRKLEQDLRSIPEISHIISKIGRSESRLDPALAWDVEVLLRYQGKFAHDPKTGRIIRQWRQQIRSAEDIREEIAERSEKLGLRLIEQGPQVDVPMFFQYFGTTAQPSIRLTGMDRAQLKAAAAQIAQILNRAESLGIAVISDAGIQDKPLITIDVKLNAMAGYGLQLEDLQLAIQMASEGKLVATLSHTAKPYQVFARYHIQKFGHIDQIKRLPIFNADGHKIELHRVADIAYLQTPMSIVSEDARPVVYLRLERRVGTRTLPHLAILTQYLDDHKQAGILQIPKGIDYQFVGFGQAQDETSLMLVMCLSLLLIFIILYLHFRSVPVIGFILIGVAIAYSGGVSIIWLYQQPWFNNFALFNLHIRDILNVSPLYLNHATWLGLVALLGLAASNGVMIAHHLQQQFATTKREDTDEPPALPSGNSEISEQIVQVCLQHIRPYLGITATTLCALLPILVSNRPNSEFMLAVAAPIFGGMLTGLLSLFVIPVFYCWKTERHFAQLKRQEQKRKRKFWWPF